MDSQLIDFKNESNRLGTFAGWPVSFIISPKSLAAAGFYYTKQTDKVKFIHFQLVRLVLLCGTQFALVIILKNRRHFVLHNALFISRNVLK